MTFQSTVRFDQAYSVPGEFATDGPKRAEPGILVTTDATQNIVGRGLSMDSANPGIWRAGDATGNGERYGILVAPKTYALRGTVAGGPLAPTLLLPNQSDITVATMGQIVVVSRDAGALVGNIVRIVKATGEIVTVPPGTAADPLMVDLPNAGVVRVPQPTAGGMIVIQLTTQ